MKHVSLPLTCVTGRSFLALAVALSNAAFAQSPPALNDFDVKVLGTINLGPQLGMPSHALQMSHVTVAPGASLSPHPHADRPEIIYVIQGRLTETRNGVTSDHGPGAVLLLTKDITHALANRSDAPVIFLAAPIAKQQ